MTDQGRSPTDPTQKPGFFSSGPWRARLIVSFILLALSLVGLIVTMAKIAKAWDYWRIMVPIFAVVCLWLSWYLRRDAQKPLRFMHTIWQELLHWLGLLVAVYIIMLFVKSGIMGHVEAGLMVITLLAFSLFVSGVYVESSFIWISMVLAIFAVGSTYVTAYLYVIVIPAILIAALLIYFVVRRSRTKALAADPALQDDN